MVSWVSPVKRTATSRPSGDHTLDGQPYRSRVARNAALEAAQSEARAPGVSRSLTLHVRRVLPPRDWVTLTCKTAQERSSRGSNGSRPRDDLLRC